MSTQVSPNRVGPFPFPKANPEQRVKDFSEVQQPYTRLEVIEEAKRCLLCGTPVCIDACPVQMDVRGMCEAVSREDFPTAYKRIRETNALLGVTARCCPQLQGLCEDACVMRWDGQPISIGMIQRFVSDWEQKEVPQGPPEIEKKSGRKVAIVGGGPSGLAAAELLLRYGHEVIIYEELASLGGTAWYGIPNYHLPKDVLLYEVQQIRAMGASINSGVKIGVTVTLSQLQGENDAVLITTGSKDVVKLDTPGISLPGVLDGYQFLEDVFVGGIEEYQKRPKYNLGSEVIVIGGGDTALDDARTAKRLTGGNVTLIYRRSENEMPSDTIMIDEAKEEGIQFMFLADPKTYNDEGSGQLKSVTLNTMQLGEPDATGRRTPLPVPGKEFVIPATSVLLAVGRGPDSFLQKKEGLKMGRKNSIAVDDHFRTSRQGVFAAGDVTTGETLVVKAMGSGREAAQRVHEFLMAIDDSVHVSLYERYFSERSYELMTAQDLGKAPISYPPPP